MRVLMHFPTPNMVQAWLSVIIKSCFEMLSGWVDLVTTKHQDLVEKAIIYRGKSHHALFMMIWGCTKG